MTRQTFYRKLRKLKGNKWDLLRGGLIRDKYDRCPIEAVAMKENIHNGSAFNQAVRLGLAKQDICVIMNAADGNRKSFGRARNALLRNLGLEETQ